MDNESGKSVLTTQISKQSHNQIDVNSLPTGFYIVQVIGNKSRFNAKFVKL
ncbi:MAG: T9SS type A sorting domain-containing protein [Saprospiraceae bacterium]|nr:T9SS type A sorting domain-containing protein [Saprospiraceae bacterium]